MSPVLYHIYGPLSIHLYGICIATGALISFYLLLHDKKMQSIATENQIITSFQIMLISGYFGGKAISLISDPDSFDSILSLFKFWEPGLSVLGGILGIVISSILYLRAKKIDILSFCDRAALYAPIVQSLGRIGCFFAGCCYGLPTSSWLSISYTNDLHMAPLHCKLIPAQLYSSLALFGLFLFLYFVQQHRTSKPGILFLSYIALSSTERFLIDFIRWDRIFITEPAFLHLFSVHQWIALAMSLLATTTILILYNRK